MAEENHYDVIMIGSGIGALTAARVLAKLKGKRTLLLEQHTSPEVSPTSSSVPGTSPGTWAFTTWARGATRAPSWTSSATAASSGRG